MKYLLHRLRRKLGDIIGTTIARPGFYSPLVDIAEVIQRGDDFWRPHADSIGIDFRARQQIELLQACAPWLAQCSELKPPDQQHSL